MSTVERCSVAVMLLFGAITLPSAQPTDDAPAVTAALAVSLRAETRVQSGNQSAYFVKATTVQEGEEIFYTVRMRNPLNHSVNGISVIQPIPATTRYIVDSAAGAGAKIEFSVDGGQSFADASALPAPQQSVTGRWVASYTHIRWTLTHPLAPQAVLLARFRTEFQ